MPKESVVFMDGAVPIRGFDFYFQYYSSEVSKGGTPMQEYFQSEGREFHTTKKLANRLNQEYDLRAPSSVDGMREVVPSGLATRPYSQAYGSLILF